MCKVMVRSWSCIVWDQEREPFCEFFIFRHCESVNQQDCPSRVIHLVPWSRIDRPTDIKTRMKGRYDYVIWGFNIKYTLKPSNHPSESDSSTKRLQVGDVSEDP